MSEIGQKSLALHKQYQGKIGSLVKVPINTQDDFATYYMPGVADVTMACTVDPQNAYTYTMKGNTVVVVSDGSSVLGLGNIGPYGALPVMEGKAMLLKRFAGIDAFPIVLATQEPEEIVKTIRNIAPAFGGVMLEDIAAPQCFMIEELLQDLGIPVMHDDQHGTAVVVRAALLNAAKVVGKRFEDLVVAVSGGGAAGQATAKILLADGEPNAAKVREIIVVDSKGIIYDGRGDLDPYKQDLATKVNKEKKQGDLKEAMKNVDAFIGLSRGNIVNPDMIKVMASSPIVFGLSNPEPEIHPDKAKEAGAAVVATGRGDYPNQVNNALGFPGIFKGALQAQTKQITMAMKIAAADVIASHVKEPKAEEIIPTPFAEGLYDDVAKAVQQAAP